MANLKISQLNQATAYTLNDVVAIVDSGNTTTSKINLNDIMRNTNNVIEDAVHHNAIMMANDAFSSNFQVLRGANTITAGVLASTNSYINNTYNAFMGGTQNSSIDNAAGHVAVIGSDGVNMTGGYNCAIVASYSGPSIISGEENFIAASVGGSQLGGYNGALIATQGVIVDGNLTAAIACEGSTQQAGNHMFIAGGYNYQGQINNLVNQAHLGFKDLNVGDGISGFNVGGSLATSGATITKAGSTMVSSQGQTTSYPWTLHTDNIHIYGTESKKTITGLTATGSVSVDLSQGSVFEFDITGNITAITFSNWREGGIYEFIVHNTGSYTITASGVRLDGVANTIYAKSGSLNPTNNGYTFYRMLIVNGKGWLNESLNYSAL